VAASVADVVVGAPPRLDVDALIEALASLHRRLAQASDPTAAIASTLLRQLHERDRRLTEIALTDFQGQLASDFSEHWERLRQVVRPGPVTVAALPDVLQRKFVGATGRLLMRSEERRVGKRGQ